MNQEIEVTHSAAPASVAAASPVAFVRRYWTWLVVAVFAAWLNWTVGHRGLFLYDASIVFDGGWRMVQGQVPYRDFFTSHAPGTYFYEALIFRLFGVTYSSMVLAATILNVFASLFAMRICYKLANRSLGLAFFAGLGTAVWFQPITGFLQIEQGAFFFALLSLTLFVEAGAEQTRRATLLRISGGMALAYGFICKQNAGGVFVPAIVGFVALLPFATWKRRARALASAALGTSICAGLFLAWVFVVSDPRLFWHHTVELASKLGSARAGRDNVIAAILMRGWPIWLKLLNRFVLIAVTAVFAHQFWYFRRCTSIMATAFLSAGIMIAQEAFRMTALNEGENAMPFYVLSLCLAAASLRQIRVSVAFAVPDGASPSGPRASVPAWVWNAVGATIAIGIVYYGFDIAWTRLVNEFVPGATFADRLNVPGANRIVWGDPTYADGRRTTRIGKTDVERTVAYLQSRNVNFFVFPESTIFYGLLHRPSVQPWLFFLEDHSFGAEDVPRLDAMALASLQRNDVRIWIQESQSWMGEHTRLNTFPRTWAWLNANFRPVAKYGMYEIFERDGDRVQSNNSSVDR